MYDTTQVGPVECEVCKDTITFINDELSQNKTVEEINATVTEICTRLTGLQLIQMVDELHIHRGVHVATEQCVIKSKDKGTLCPFDITVSVTFVTILRWTSYTIRRVFHEHSL